MTRPYRDFRRPALAIFGALFCGGGALGQEGGQGGADAVALAPHRAVYDLKLVDARGKQSLEGARARILYDFVGSACEGYALQFRQVTELSPSEGKTLVSDLRSTNWEEGSGKTFRFTSENFLNGGSTEKADGSAEREGDDVRVKLRQPERDSFELKGVVFPSDHMRRVIAAAREGKSLVEVAVYDGSDNGKKVYNTTTVIGRPIADDRQPQDAAAGQAWLAGQKRWPVTVSYFDRAKAGGDQTPAYSISFELAENGISRAIKIDYGEFVLGGNLTSLEVKEAKPCR